MSGRQMSQTAKYQGAKCLGREMSLPPIVWGTYCPGSQISGRQMSQRQLSGADRRAPNVRQPSHLNRTPLYNTLSLKYKSQQLQGPLVENWA